MPSVTLDPTRPKAHDDPDENLADFLARHEAGPCPACPASADDRDGVTR